MDPMDLEMGLHLGLRVETGDDGVETGRETEVVHLFGSFADCVFSVDPCSVHVSFLDCFLDFEFFCFLFFFAFPCLTLERF